MKKNNNKEILKLCPHCGNRAPMIVATSYEHQIIYGDPPYTDEDNFLWSLFVCPNCDKPILDEKFRSSFEMDIDRWPIHEKTLYPYAQVNLRGLPENISKSYEAALKVRHIEHNAFAVLIGRTLEIICKDKNARGNNLFEKLDYLCEQDVIPGRLVEMAHGIRQLRNIGAHADLGEIVEFDIQILTDFTEAILEYIYRAPTRLEILQNRLNTLNKGE
ncbi:MAG: DUF4145 domain-containing protein [Firmicutes bacterium]|nr:DUF4145 domain-containing protein [Bacillota bacterium]